MENFVGYVPLEIVFFFFCFPGGSVVKNLPTTAGDMSLIPDPVRPHMPQIN